MFIDLEEFIELKRLNRIIKDVKASGKLSAYGSFKRCLDNASDKNFFNTNEISDALKRNQEYIDGYSAFFDRNVESHQRWIGMQHMQNKIALYFENKY